MFLVVLDIDGTLACDSRRKRLAGPRPDPHNKVEFSAWLERLQPPGALADDPPVSEVVAVARKLQSTTQIVVLTGRSERYREETEFWLRRQGLGAHRLIMREDQDWRSAAGYKEAAMRKLTKQFGPNLEVLVIDDDPEGDCSPVYQKNGYVHLKVLR